MIGRLTGRLVLKAPPALLLDVGGVGYELEAPMSTFCELPPLEGTVTLITHLAIKEDAHTLYGFLTEAERALFRALLKVSGIGAKTALAVLSGASVDEFARLIAQADVAALKRLPGVGPKTAERLIVELKDKLGSGLGSPVSGMTRGAPVPADPAAEAAVALAALGYKPQEVTKLVKDAAEPGMSAEAIIRKALQLALKSRG